MAAEDAAYWAARDCEGREPSDDARQAMCGLISWATIATTIAEAATPADEKALEQQNYGGLDLLVQAMGLGGRPPAARGS